MKHAALGLLLTAVVSGVVWGVWGRPTVPIAAAFGLIATLIHVAAVGLLRPVLTPPFDRLAKRWAMGMGSRFVGVAALAIFVLRDPGPELALASAVGFLGVMIPLLFSEMYLLWVSLRTKR